MRVEYMMFDHITHDLFKVVVVAVVLVVVIGMFSTIILFTSKKMYSVSGTEKNQIRNE